ncbi:MAG: DNA repair protein RecN [Clostridia bacterium]|jgi:DNA repair protein RecN (Recombination protein N)|nr:DNA repair protein RecN [Clostridia bacterium]
MLMAIEICNFAIIDTMRIELDRGLNVLTGETGAGKSIVIDAVDLLLGGRASSEFIRSGTNRTQVAGIFCPSPSVYGLMEEMGLEPEEDNILLLQREISNNGPNLCRINGKQVTLSMYRLLGSKLIDIYGQHEHHSLMDRQQHLEIIDLLAGEPLATIKGELYNDFLQLAKIHEKIENLTVNQQDNLQKLDLWNYQLKEINAAMLQPGEEEQLLKDKKVLAGMEKLTFNTRIAYETLKGSGKENARDLLVSALSQLEGVKDVDERLAVIANSIESCLYHVEDTAEELRSYVKDLVFDPDRLEEIETRLAKLSMLKRKYGSSIDDIIRYEEDLATKINELDNLDETLKNLEREYQAVKEHYLSLAKNASSNRKKTAMKLEQQVMSELRDLEMSNTLFKVEMEQVDKPTKNGLDKIEFVLSANPGEPLKPLTKIASGGELSRIMLALKVIIAAVDDVPTLIFDEIDTGIGGRAVQTVVEKLKQISSSRQVICVTHSPQIAGRAHFHFHLSKDMNNNRVTTKVKLLSMEERIEEIARMLTGNKVTATTLQQAKEILHN